MSNDCISRQAAIDAILDLTDFASVIDLFEDVEEHDLQDKRSGGIIDAIDAVLLLPSVQPEVLACGKGELTVQSERKTGRWKLQTIKGKDIVYCSECAFGVHTEETRRYNFCPNCGARMSHDD